MRTALANKIIELRKERDWTQDELARHAGVNRGTLASIETGKVKKPGTDILLKFARAFNINENELYQAAGYIRDIKPIPRQETHEEILNRYRIAMPSSVPIYEDFTLHAGEPRDLVDYIPIVRDQARGRELEGYVVKGSCLEPYVRDGDVIIIDRNGNPDNGDIVACLISNELHLARLRKIAGDTYLENNHGRWKLEEAAIAAPVIEVRRRLK